ncbi:hypothetical protein MSAR_47780 [Mycolicibacterium sarraceniae]|uniref:Uncharacterized protein n=1 Tax=Mycolicibacterium sarraceniae TaxID=1534348 RepID=A0A7I7SX79_9MYCO|nr:hypothetical protein MSAR_47780 [Mycolicibacterium sarraceniae]
MHHTQVVVAGAGTETTGRVALDELLNRFPDWDIDYAGAKLAPTSTVRGRERLPTVLP